jgi:hypothetical protein
MPVLDDAQRLAPLQHQLEDPAHCPRVPNHLHIRIFHPLYNSCNSGSLKKQTGSGSRINIFSLPGQHTPARHGKKSFFRLLFPADFTDNISTPRWPLFTTLKSPQLLSGEASSGLSYALGPQNQR